MRIVALTTEIFNALDKEGVMPPDSGDRTKWVEARHRKHNEILASLNCPIELGRLEGVHEDVKTGKYQAKFVVSTTKKFTLRATNEITAFLAEHATKAGYWIGRMEDGALVDVHLITHE